MPNLKSFFPHKGRRSSTPADSPTFFGQGDGISHYVEQDPTVGEWLRDVIPNGSQVIRYLSNLFPFSRWIFSYNLRWLLGDMIAGITVGLVVIPQGMAYAKLAGLPVQFGLYTSFMGALVYWYVFPNFNPAFLTKYFQDLRNLKRYQHRPRGGPLDGDWSNSHRSARDSSERI